MRPRIEAELALLREQYGTVDHKEVGGEDWFRLPAYPLPPGWCLGSDPVDRVPIVFKVTATYPGTAPYAFLAPAGLNFNGDTPANTSASARAPFEGAWMQFSWAHDGSWVATSDPHSGSNLLAWARSFRQRFQGGV